MMLMARVAAVSGMSAVTSHIFTDDRASHRRARDSARLGGDGIAVRGVGGSAAAREGGGVAAGRTRASSPAPSSASESAEAESRPESEETDGIRSDDRTGVDMNTCETRAIVETRAAEMNDSKTERLHDGMTTSATGAFADTRKSSTCS